MMLPSENTFGKRYKLAKSEGVRVKEISGQKTAASGDLETIAGAPVGS